MPIGNVVGALFVTVKVEQLSIVTGVPRARFATVHPEVMANVIAAGAKINGAALSTTLTV